MHSKRVAIALAVFAPLTCALMACGSDSTSPAAHATPATDTILADIAALGMLTGDSAFSGTDTAITYGFQQTGSVQYAEWDHNGQSTPDEGAFWRPVMRFDLPALRGLAVVDSATLTIFQCASYAYASNIGTSDPFVVGHLAMDHITLRSVFDGSAATVMADTLGPSVTFTRDSSTGFKSRDVSGAVAADYAATRASAQFRLQWVFDAAPMTATFVNYGVSLGSSCEGALRGPAPFLVIWSH